MDTVNPNPTPNPFDPAALRLDQSFADTVGVKRHLMTVPVRKPNRQDFVRVHPDPAFRLTPAAIIEVKEDREVYLVPPGMAQQVPGEFSVTRSTLVSADFGGSGNLNVLAEILVLFLAGLGLGFAQKDGNQKK